MFYILHIYINETNLYQLHSRLGANNKYEICGPNIRYIKNLKNNFETNYLFIVMKLQNSIKSTGMK